MKNPTALLMTLLVLCIPFSGLAQDEEDQIISIYEGSRLIYDDRLGFEEYPIVIDGSAISLKQGILRRQWCRAPEGRSPLEVIRNYESAIRQKGGEILFSTRDPQSLEIEEEKLAEYFTSNRLGRGLATNVFSYTYFPGLMSEFLVGKIATPGSDVYLTIATGRGHNAARENDITFFEIVTLEAESMEMDMVTMDALREGLAVQGRVAVYNIYFETGESTVRKESAEALEVIAEFLKQDPAGRFLVVGHTDNVGSYEMNLDLSEARANAVVEKLVNGYGVSADRLKPVGVGPASPVLSNSTEEGKARNRRVEIVER